MAIQTTASDLHLRSSKAMSLNALTPFSVCVWLNATWSTGTRQSMVGIYGPATDTPLAQPVTAMQFGTVAADSVVCWTWGGGTLVQGTGMSAFNGQWVFLTYTFDGTSHHIYRNGALIATATATQLPGFLNQVYINGYPGGAAAETGAFQVDQYAIYRRELSQPEIETMFNARGARHGITAGLIAQHEFDELGQGSTVVTVRDVSINAHDLTTVGAGTPMTYTYSNTVANTNLRTVL